MPELPEVETVRRSLRDRVVGQRVAALRLTDFPGVLGGARLEDVQPRVTGREIQEIRRRAKYLFFDLDDGTGIVVHLRMTGILSLLSPDAPQQRHERLAINLGNQLELRFSDQRKFGRVIHLQDDELEALDARIGIEPLENAFSPEWLSQALRGRSGKIKSLLLDQRLIGGLGNIYVDEALFRAGIHPERAGGSVTTVEAIALHRAIQEILTASIERQGTTFSSFEDPYGNRGEFASQLLVYGRGGKLPCVKCGSPLRRVVIGGRGTSFCPTCQPASASA